MHGFARPVPAEGGAPVKHLLDTAALDREDIEELLGLTAAFVEVSSRAVPRVPTLRGRVVALIDEGSSRPRLSFETAAKRLSADTVAVRVSGSPVDGAESLRDTALAVEAMGADAVVVRHRSSGAPHRVASWVDLSVINGGDGRHDHPTQALLDCHTLRRRLGSLEGRSIAIVGDVNRSGAARGDVHAFTTLGAEVVLVAPPTLLPPSLDGWPVTVSYDLDEVLGSADAVCLLRMSQDSVTEGLVPTLREYTARYGLTAERARRLGDQVVLLHPDPMHRGVEIDPEVADDPRAVNVDQVRDGVAVRMAVLFRLLGSEVRAGRSAAAVAPDDAVSDPGADSRAEARHG